MGWIIAGAIVAFFALLLAGRVTVYFDYNDSLALKIKYMCFTVMKLPKTKKKAKKPKKEKAEKSETGDDENGKKKTEKKKKFDIKKLTFDDMLELLKLALSGIGKPLKRLFKSIKFSHMSIRVVVGGDDAAKTAIKFGAMNIAAGNALGLIDTFFTLKPLDDMNITCDFGREETLYDVYFEVRLSLFAAVVAVIRLLKVLFKLMKGYKRAAAKNKLIRSRKSA